jgi:hypothetical protein
MSYYDITPDSSDPHRTIEVVARRVFLYSITVCKVLPSVCKVLPPVIPERDRRDFTVYAEKMEVLHLWPLKHLE